MQVPQCTCHAQSIQKYVKEVTESAGRVYRYTDEKRDGYIRGQVASRWLLTKNESKQELMKLVV